MMFSGWVVLHSRQSWKHIIQEKDLRKCARYLLKCKQAMWRRWSTEYLRGLRERHNQNHKKTSFTVKKGDVVIIQSDERSRGKWPLGVVDELYKGRGSSVNSFCGSNLRSLRCFSRFMDWICHKNFIAIWWKAWEYSSRGSKNAAA
jgi:hypothetical protein